MKIHSICLAKNEADIIAQTLTAATEWSDYIYVVDNGSDDDTWKIVLNLAERYSQIVAYKQDKRTFFDGMRAEIFNQFRSNGRLGDWWCRLDADEFYIDNPQDFLNNVESQYQAVWAASFQYYFTDRDLKDYESNPELFSDVVPVQEKCRYYSNNWSENRFFKYDQRIVWDKEHGWPYFGTIYPKRIRMRHYQYRSPQQIQQRLIARLEARSKGSSCFSHEAADKETMANIADNLWKQRIVNASELTFDRLDGAYVAREDLMPPVPKSYFPFVENKVRFLKKYINSSTLKKLPFANSLLSFKR